MLAYSARNRSASIRIPWVSNPKARRIETRFPDPSANPYLCFTALLMAGLDGINNKIHPGDAMDKDLYDLPPEEVAGIPTVAHTLTMALDALEADWSADDATPARSGDNEATGPDDVTQGAGQTVEAERAAGPDNEAESGETESGEPENTVNDEGDGHDSGDRRWGPVLRNVFSTHPATLDRIERFRQAAATP